MGKKADDIEREIEELRANTDLLLEELERRLRETMNVRAQVEHHPLVTTALTLSLLVGIGLIVYNTFFRPRLEIPTREAKQRSQQGFLTTMKELGDKAYEAAKTVSTTLSKD